MASSLEQTLFAALCDLLNQRWAFLILQLQTIVSMNPDRNNFAVITDLDGTIASDDPKSPQTSNVGSIIFPNAKRFLDTCARLNVSVFIITARINQEEVYELFRLNGIDRTNMNKLVTKLYVRPSESTAIAEAKKFQRHLVRSSGYDILMIVGDNEADLAVCDNEEHMMSSARSVNVLFDNPFAGQPE